MTEEQQQRVVAGRYTVLRELGRGGMGVVWLAEDSTIGRRVAVKELLLPAGIAPDERHVFEERVLREARTAGRLNDPGIVTVHDVLQEDGNTFIVMELIEAPNLADVIKQHGPMPPDQVLRVADGVLSALVAAHAAGVVHRDVKPSNVIVAPNGRVKLADFGIAQSTEDTRLTTSGTLIGSPSYISPDRLLGQDASPASDLWALGATLFFAVEGFGAFDRPTAAASIQAIMNERATVRTAHGPLASLITGLLDPDPTTRLNAAQARHMIDQARTNTQPPAPGNNIPVGSTQVLPPPKKNRRVIAIAAAAVVLVGAVVAVLAVTGVFGSARSGPAQGAPNTAPPNTAPPNTVPSDGVSSPAPATGAAPPQWQAATYGPGGDLVGEDLGDAGCYTYVNAEFNGSDCTQPHELEVFDTIGLDADFDTYPDHDQLVRTVTDKCRQKYADLGTTARKPLVDPSVAVPTKEAWDAEKHRGLCVVRGQNNGLVSGSVSDN